MKFLFSMISLISPVLASAQFEVAQPRGEAMFKFQTPQQKQELCIIPQHSQLGQYSEDDLKEEKELCSYDFHGLTQDREVKQMALCPKLNSTNPGVLVMEIPENWDRKKFEAEKCIGENDLQETEAKFKQSITCSYTPSILAYYHFSRYLNGAGRVPVAVLRTMSKERHEGVTNQAYGPAQKVGGAIRKGWSDLKSYHANPQSQPLLFDRRGEFVFGALSTNIKNERKYYEIVGTGSYEDRYKSFVTKDFYKQVASSRNILDVIGADTFAKVAQPMLMLKDVVDMILLDTILSQQDRMYNQHYKYAWVWIENGEVKRKRVKAKQDDKGNVEFTSKKDQAELAEFKSKNAVMVKELIMKDNDCGVRARFYRNRMKEVKALEGVKHMSGATYTSFLRLAKSLRDPQMLNYLKNETLMTDADLKQMMANVFASEELLKSKCQSGDLKLDLDLETHFSDKAPRYSCEI